MSYAQCLQSTDKDLVTFDLADPDPWTVIGPGTAATDFLSGGDLVEDVWYACEYNTASSNIWTIDETTGTMTLLGASGVALNGLAYDDSTDTLYGCSSTSLYSIDKATGVASLIGAMGNGGGTMIGIASDGVGNLYGEDLGDDNLYSINTVSGAATIIGSLGVDLNYAQDMAIDKDDGTCYITGYKGSTAGGGALMWVDLTTGHATLIEDFPIGDMGCPAEVDCFAIPYEFGGGGGGYPPIKVWVAPGTQQIEAVVGNDGTFVETDLTCYASLYRYNDDPENGTWVWDGSVSNIDLDPLGDEETIPFGSQNFDQQGPWGLYIELPLGVDDKQNNNLKELGIGVDNTKPTSSHTLSPANPDGLNGWYISDVTVTVTAEDGTQDWQSGVDFIQYTINGGAPHTIAGDHGSFKVEDDGEDIPVEYWAVDKVGNVESHHTFTIDMDQTKPQITLEYEVTGGNQWQGWELTWTATATDATSHMERVEFLLNGVLQETVTGPGPQYQWVIMYYLLPHTIFKVIGYDMAGLSDYYEVENPTPRPHSNQQSTQPMTTIKINLGR
jgi:hypothetical protein